MNQLTIVTPVYNRAYCIKKIFDSLCRQTTFQFDWMIIDDGSTDNLDELVNSFRAKFNIVYRKKVNGGKCSALNRAIKQCNTALLLVVDSDDYLKEDAVQKIYEKWAQVQLEKSVIGIVANRIFEGGKLSGKAFPQNIEYITMNELNYHYHHRGETALIFRTDILKQHLFPEYDGESFLSEVIQYNELDKCGRLAILREPIIVMEYLEDGLTANYFNNWIKNPKGTKHLLQSRYNHTEGLRFVDIMMKRIKTILLFDILSLKSSSFGMEESPNPIVGWLCLPAALIVKWIKYK